MESKIFSLLIVPRMPWIEFAGFALLMLAARFN
jgi:hypothetical protein